MLEFIQLIKQRYQAVLTQLDKKNPQYPEYQQRIEQLIYGEAFIRKGRLQADHPAFPLQIAVIGPTQSGKSSVVNVLLNAPLAGVSPLAGFTVHPHGFCNGLSEDTVADLQHYFGRFQRLDADMLSKNRFDCYSLMENSGNSPLLPSCVCWDTPDFDSIDAADYREGVVRTIALADIIVLVVSKEKYADLAVWEVMQTIAPFQQPTLICVNKLNEGNEPEVLQSFQEKWRQYRQDPLPDVVPLLFQKQDGIPVWPATSAQIFLKLSKKVSYCKHPVFERQWLQKYWQQWLEPVFAEHHAQQVWQMLLDRCLEQAAKDFQRDYLDHPHHYETFQNALLNMLNLLEIPGIAKLAGKTRRIMTWPFRTLFGIGRAPSGGNAAQEVLVLNQIGEHLMIQLADRLLEKTETEALPLHWWKEAAVMLRQRKSEILQNYFTSVDEYHRYFQQDVEAAAQRLYGKLQEQPVLLNSLRATRMTTDTAAVLLAVHAGGIGMHDLVITPVMLSITSLLAESAIGGYMARVEAELKQQQLKTVVDRLFFGCLRRKLEFLPQQSFSVTRFNISEQQCVRAEQSLKESKHGLRLL